MNITLTDVLHTFVTLGFLGIGSGVIHGGAVSTVTDAAKLAGMQSGSFDLTAVSHVLAQGAALVAAAWSHVSWLGHKTATSGK